MRVNGDYHILNRRENMANLIMSGGADMQQNCSPNLIGQYPRRVA